VSSSGAPITVLPNVKIYERKQNFREENRDLKCSKFRRQPFKDYERRRWR